MQIQFLVFQPHGDDRGQLIALEEGKEIPFPIRRVYYVYATAPEAVRGRHAHRSLRQVLVCVHGSCRVRLDDGRERCEVLLDSPRRGLEIDGLLWREMDHFSPDAVLMVLASELYDESDYIRDYQAFRALAEEMWKEKARKEKELGEKAFGEEARP